MRHEISRILLLGLCATTVLAACGDDEETTPEGEGTGGGGGEVSLEEAYFTDAARSTLFVDPMLGDPTNLTAPNFVPAAGSPVAGAGVAPSGDFFTATDYIGAFEPGGTDWTAGWTAYAPNAQSTVAADATIVTVGENITENITWTADTVYQLTATVYVTGGATLTIEPGTLVIGDNGSALIVTSDAMLMAEGTAEAPIVFTSSQDPANRAPSDWGGIVMLGNAPINVGTNNIEGVEAAGISAYGGTDVGHDCGTLSYVRIEYAGFTFGQDNELNSLTLGGCGTSTTLEHIQTVYGSDDGIEFFGGGATLKWAVVSQTGDDSLDWDQGYNGNIQFFVAQQAPGTGDRGIEADNLEDNPTATPISSPTIYNMTLIGGGAANTEQRGITLRRGTHAQIYNAIVMNFGKGSINFDGAESQAAAGSGLINMSNNLIFGIGSDGVSFF
jgi:uncharacterized membrane protein